jgi:hypothetical protein
LTYHTYKYNAVSLVTYMSSLEAARIWIWQFIFACDKTSLEDQNYFKFHVLSLKSIGIRGAVCSKRALVCLNIISKFLLLLQCPEATKRKTHVGRQSGGLSDRPATARCCQACALGPPPLAGRTFPNNYHPYKLASQFNDMFRS